MEKEKAEERREKGGRLFLGRLPPLNVVNVAAKLALFCCPISLALSYPPEFDLCDHEKSDSGSER